MIPTSKLRFWTLLIAVLTCVSIGNTANASIVWEQSTKTGAQAFGLGIVTEYAWQFTATTTFSIDSIFAYLFRDLGGGTMDSNSCVRMLIYASSSGAVGDPLASSANCVTQAEIVATTTYTGATAHEFAFSPFELSPNDYFLSLRHEGTTGACAGSCVGAVTTAGTDSYFRNGGAWTYNSATIMSAIMYGSPSGFQSIEITSPINGANIAENYTTVTINYSNPNAYTQINVCTYFPASMYLAQGQNPCENGGDTWSIGESGTISYIYVNSLGTSTRRIAVGFNDNDSLIPDGVRYYDYDYSYFGFHVPASTASSTFGLEDNGTSTASSLGLSSAFTQWNVLQTKYPLNWIFESYTILSNLEDATATVAIPDATITFTAQNVANLGYTQPATSSRTQTFFSSTTLENVASIPGWSNIRTLESWILWIGLVWWVWQRKEGLLVIKQQ